MRCGERPRAKRWVAVLAVAAAVSAAAGEEPGGQGPLAARDAASRLALGEAGLERLEVEAAGRRLVLWRGGGGPDLVLLHGSGQQAGGWSAVAPGLSADFTVHALDLPGHGDSEPAEGPLPMADIVAGVEAYLDSLEAPAILVGNSLGAWLATLRAHRHPERVARVVLVNGGALLNIPPAGVTLTPADREEARRAMAAIRDPASPALSDEVLDDIVRRGRSGPTPRMMQDLPSLMAHLLDGRLGEVTVPVDLLWGASDRLMPLAYARRMEAELPRARLTVLEGCGHVPMNECPERFLVALRAVLALSPPAPVEEPTAATAADGGTSEETEPAP
ncbi:MAG TPA: alpha/beta fold hydrolase [Thermoanaerobaculia bacterium]|nr:alpha/beta fold hydrolase [Thermoanaerobaculia bacterium]